MGQQGHRHQSLRRPLHWGRGPPGMRLGPCWAKLRLPWQLSEFFVSCIPFCSFRGGGIGRWRAEPLSHCGLQSRGPALAGPSLTPREVCPRLQGRDSSLFYPSGLCDSAKNDIDVRQINRRKNTALIMLVPTQGAPQNCERLIHHPELRPGIGPWGC